MKLLFVFALLFIGFGGFTQNKAIEVLKAGSLEPVAFCTIQYGNFNIIANSSGISSLPEDFSGNIKISATGFESKTILISERDSLVKVYLITVEGKMDEVVVTGTMRAVRRSQSPVAVEIYTPKFFMKNPTPSLFDALQLVNGIRPQLNCNICNTGDIHINGLEGPYTTILIDGMPIVSSLASVYGLAGIPNSIVDRIEVVKGPASSLYGSEAIGGLINVITKNPSNAPVFSLDLSSTTWKEYNADMALKYSISPRIKGLAAVNYFDYSLPEDLNKDNFTDVTLQHRISLFNKITVQRKNNRLSSLALRYIYEDRWGGEMNWTNRFRGTDSLYGEQATTSRFELIGNYQIPVSEKILFSYSLNTHEQRSAYGTMLYNANQNTLFGQLTWDKAFSSKHNLLGGITGRYTFYDDNTPATFDSVHRTSIPEKIFLPGIFVQSEINAAPKHNLLFGLRYDYDSRHGNIVTPRFAYKFRLSENDIFRLNTGTGFRVVNIFTEDHAALTGARTIVFADKLKPEQSVNINLNYIKNIQFGGGWLSLDLSAWYTRFSNKIVPDYTTNTTQIIYGNLDGYAISRGLTLNSELAVGNALRLTLGGTLMNVGTVSGSGEIRQLNRQLLTEKWTSTWALSYAFIKNGISIDYTGNIYGPMLLPLLSEHDPRSPESPVWSIQNIQATKKISNRISVYGGVKNLLNFTPAKHTPFIISRAHDPFDKQVSYSSSGEPLVTADNPYGLTFDPGYAYAPNQGIRGFLGFRFLFD